VTFVLAYEGVTPTPHGPDNAFSMKTDCFKGLSSSYTRLAHLIGLQPDEVGSDTQHLECGITLSFSLALKLYTCGLDGRDMFPTPRGPYPLGPW
jgi:hypothetical protein